MQYHNQYTMKVLLQSRKTKLYVQGKDQWTPERALARDFLSSAEAIFFASHNRLQGMYLVLAHDPPSEDAYMPLTDLGG